MQEVAAVSSLAVTLGLVLARPRLTARIRIGPAPAAAAGVVLMVITGLIDLGDVREAATALWRPLLTITGIMVLTAGAHRLNVLDSLAREAHDRARGSTTRLFFLVFVLSAATSATLNNDAAVLLLTPLVVLLVRSVYPDRPRLIAPFAFAVFMAAGVAPLVVSNPMNMIVADVAGIGFNEYAIRMLPVSIAGWILAYPILRWVFRKDLASEPEPVGAAPSGRGFGAPQWQMVVVLGAVLLAYPVVSYAGGPIFIVAGAGALVALWLCLRHGVGRPLRMLATDVSWETLVFLLGALLLAFGLRNAGLVDFLSDLYSDTGIAVIGATSSVGSAVVNNHPMALINTLAIQGADGASRHDFLAALIGGDLGPRLLPIGSLAGLLWYASLRRDGIEIPVWRFVVVGATVAIPTLALSIGILALMP